MCVLNSLTSFAPGHQDFYSPGISIHQCGMRAVYLSYRWNPRVSIKELILPCSCFCLQYSVNITLLLLLRLHFNTF